MFYQLALMRQEVEWRLHMMKWKKCEISRELYTRKGIIIRLE